MLNALAGKHLLRTGTCRTTTEPALIARDPAFGLAWHESELASDDGVELRAIDLPGITDAENEGGTFDAMALEWAKRCDVVCWVSDVRTAFLTTHEKSEWHRLKAALQRKADFDGSLYQTCVVLTKCDASPFGTSDRSYKKETRRGVGGELECDDEETTIEDCVARVSRVLGDERIVRFNAFGRIVHRGASATLLSLVRKTGHRAPDVNTRLDMQWAASDLVLKRQAQLVRVIRVCHDRVEELERREAAIETERAERAERAALESRPALEIEFAFYVAGTRVCLRLDASTATARELLDGCNRPALKVNAQIDGASFRLYDSYTAGDIGVSDGVKCAPRKGDVYHMPLRIGETSDKGLSCTSLYSHCVRMRTEEGRACFDAYKIGTVTEGLDALLLIPLPFGPKKAEADAPAEIKVVCPLYDFLVSALTRPTATADEVYALYSATPVQGPMTRGQFRQALIFFSEYGARGDQAGWCVHIKVKVPGAGEAQPKIVFL
jgi:hypothetical protein